jgi:hypothetical protein
MTATRSNVMTYRTAGHAAPSYSNHKALITHFRSSQFVFLSGAFFTFTAVVTWNQNFVVLYQELS